MKRILLMDFLDSNKHVQSAGLFILRFTAFIVVFPHGAQLLLGLFGGYGFNQTMDYFTGTVKLPWIIGLFVIFIQFFGAMLLLLGWYTRLNAMAMLAIFAGMIFTNHIEHGFFMNWFGNNSGEGFEYHLLIIGIMLGLVFMGAGKYSLDNNP
ncbi:DoxX family protein [Flavobacterium wongokense]|uniref:DoxX family protein n=1 Tax=Flavobacterium wongokense TaxID=2910674 RepID=UPI001F343C39|nr:DoxX family protein [Flavobacterium sp. WG47]MCF6132778.1 DoxX family protein [Flavobacterium sp. WG47]